MPFLTQQKRENEISGAFLCSGKASNSRSRVSVFPPVSTKCCVLEQDTLFILCTTEEGLHMIHIKECATVYTDRYKLFHDGSLEHYAAEL